VECTSACITALLAFSRQHPGHRRGEIERAVKKAESFIRRIQRPDGSWWVFAGQGRLVWLWVRRWQWQQGARGQGQAKGEKTLFPQPKQPTQHKQPTSKLRYGSWGVCFTYAGWFGCAALAALGRSVDDDPALARAAAFIAGKQRLDGGWGESYLSCQDKVGWVVGGVGGCACACLVNPLCLQLLFSAHLTLLLPPLFIPPITPLQSNQKVYSQLEGASHVVNTAWAMMALMSAGYHEKNPGPLHK
jgi:cycloartenol synthase